MSENAEQAKEPAGNGKHKNRRQFLVGTALGSLIGAGMNKIVHEEMSGSNQESAAQKVTLRLDTEIAGAWLSEIIRTSENGMRYVYTVPKESNDDIIANLTNNQPFIRLFGKYFFDGVQTELIHTVEMRLEGATQSIVLTNKTARP